MTTDTKAIFAQRKKARFIAVQALYQWLITKTPVNELLTQSRMDNVKKSGDWSFFDRLVRGVIQDVDLLDACYTSDLDRPFEQISPIEKTILRLGAFELLQCPDIPYVVVIDEYISLAKLFGATDGHKYVNSILHLVAAKTRQVELAAYQTSRTLT